MSGILQRTQSVCPVCFKRVDAVYAERDGQVVLEKTCPQHGAFSTPVWDSAEHFNAWVRETPPQTPKGFATQTNKGCPYDCGLCEAHGQASCCVLLEVTQRCNLKCPVCYAAAGEYAAETDVPMEVITGWYDMLMQKSGPVNIQLSGGEPTLRDDLPQIIQAGRQRGFTFFQLNTNGLRLAQDKPYLKALVAAGLSTVFLQFDSLKAAGCIQLRGQDLVATKKRAIEHCAEAGVGVVLVPTVKADCNLHEVGAIVDFAAGQLPAVRGVHFQPISFFGRYNDASRAAGRVTVPALLAALEKQTDGRVKAADFAPGSAEHSLCSFHADYGVRDGVWSAQKSTGGCCGPSPASSDRARNAVAEKWSTHPVPSVEWTGKSGYDLTTLDDFLTQRNTQTLALSGMAFQDAWTLDLARLCRCHVHVVSPNGTLIPFCAHNLTNTQGAGLHR